MDSVFQLIKQRQEIIAQHLKPNSSVLFFSGLPKIRNHTSEYSFRVDSDFYYLTGIDEPHSLLLLHRDKKGQLVKFLVIYNPTPTQQQWSCDHTLQIQNLENEFFNHYDSILSWQNKEKTQEVLQKIQGEIFTLAPLDKNISKDYHFKTEHHSALREQLSLLRAQKSEAEISLMRVAQKYTNDSFKALLSKPYLSFHSEKDIAAQWYAYAFQHGLEQAYNPIIASGKNACVLHYQLNKADFKSHDPQAVLIDAGYEYQYYASDITRILFLKKPTQAFQEIYEIVLKTQEKIIHQIAPNQNISELQKMTQEHLLKELQILGVFTQKQTLDDLKNVYMHGIGHHLGLDVHDCHGLDRKTSLKESMILTVEPGLYFNHPRFENTPWYNIGIRLEDNILVTSTGFENLTDIPKKLSDLIHV